MSKVYFMLPLAAVVSACGSNEQSNKPMSSEAPPVAVASAVPTEEISAKKLGDQNWDCDTGSPDAAVQRITLSNLVDNNGVVTGDYRNFIYAIDMDDNGRRTIGERYSTEYGKVSIENGVYKFLLDKNRSKDSNGLPDMKVGSEGREKILTEILTKAQEREMNNSESGDSWAITCKPGHNLNRN